MKDDNGFQETPTLDELLSDTAAQPASSAPTVDADDGDLAAIMNSSPHVESELDEPVVAAVKKPLMTKKVGAIVVGIVCVGAAASFLMLKDKDAAGLSPFSSEEKNSGPLPLELLKKEDAVMTPASTASQPLVAPGIDSLQPKAPAAGQPEPLTGGALAAPLAGPDAGVKTPKSKTPAAIPAEIPVPTPTATPTRAATPAVTSVTTPAAVSIPLATEVTATKKKVRIYKKKKLKAAALARAYKKSPTVKQATSVQRSVEVPIALIAISRSSGTAVFSYGGAYLTISEGGTVGGLKLLAIAGEHVKLDNNGCKEIMFLSKGSSK